MTNGFLGNLTIVSIFASLVVLFISLPIHSFTKAYTAKKLGDPTADNMGRLTLNPFAHINPWGALALIFFRFGWSKPLPVDSRNLKKPKRDLGIIAAIGPLSYLLLAFLFCIPVVILSKSIYSNPTMQTSPNNASMIFFELLLTIVVVNIQLAVINLLPIMPFDGGDILAAFLPAKYSIQMSRFFIKNQGVITVLLLVLLSTGLLTRPIIWLSQKIFSFFFTVIATFIK